MSESKANELLRRVATQEINAIEGSREYLEAEHGQVWDTDQLRTDFEVTSFCVPCVGVIRKSDRQRGTLFFQHSPRFYWGFEAD